MYLNENRFDLDQIDFSVLRLFSNVKNLLLTVILKIKMSFSERIGITPKKSILVNDLDQNMRTGIINAYTLCLHDRVETNFDSIFKKRMALLYLKVELNDDYICYFGSIIQKFFREKEWYEVFDLIESFESERIHAQENYGFPFLHALKQFSDIVNGVLESECSGYRIIEGQITPITDENEINSLASAVRTKNTVGEHMTKALQLFSNRENPDYANSIKESISAVEAICKKITGKGGSTLGAALSIIENKRGVPIQKAFAEGMKNLYGYTSNADGIRHAKMSLDENTTQEEAQFMLVACSAFVNYMRVLAHKSGISLM